MGATGSGKTVLITRLMSDVLPKLYQMHSRALIYDAKQDIVQALTRMGLRQDEHFKILHPFDKRSYAWDMAKDIVDPISARQMSTILVPDEDKPGENSGFFTNAVRELLTGVLLVFINCANEGAWTFRDVILAMLYPQYLARLLAMNQTREGEEFYIPTRLRESYLPAAFGNSGADPRTASNIRSTISTRLSVYEPIAAAWDKAQKQGRTFSLNGWMRSNDILVLGNDEASRTALDAVNRCLFKRMTELVLAKEEALRKVRESGRDLTWVFFDEIREAGLLDGLSRLLTKGRSKGVVVILGFQDIEGLRAVYGDEVANELTGQCHGIVVLKLNSPSTAQWAADLFGKRIETFELDTIHVASTGAQWGSGKQQQERGRIYTADLLYLPPTSEKNGLWGYQRWSGQSINDNPFFRLGWQDIQPYLGQEPDEENEEADDEGRSKKTASFDPRDPRDQYLKVWDRQDWCDRLGFDKDLFPSLDPADQALENTPEEDAAMETVREERVHILDIPPL